MGGSLGTAETGLELGAPNDQPSIGWRRRYRREEA